jgi:hypothetical protein
VTLAAGSAAGQAAVAPVEICDAKVLSFLFVIPQGYAFRSRSNLSLRPLHIRCTDRSQP